MNLYGEFWHDVKCNMLEKLSKYISRKYQNLNKKLNTLQQINRKTTISKQTCFQFHDLIQNLTNTQFTKDELDKISKYFKSNVPNNNIQKQIENLIVESEHILQTNNLQNREAVRYQIHKLIEKHIQIALRNNSNHSQNKNINMTINKIKNNNLTVSKADKDNIIVIQEKDELRNKTLEFLNNPIYNKIRTDPTSKYQKELKQAIKQSNLIFDNSYYYLINPNPSAPKL